MPDALGGAVVAWDKARPRHGGNWGGREGRYPRRKSQQISARAGAPMLGKGYSVFIASACCSG